MAVNALLQNIEILGFFELSFKRTWQGGGGEPRRDYVRKEAHLPDDSSDLYAAYTAIPATFRTNTAIIDLFYDF